MTIPVNVVVERVVAGQSDQSALADAEGKENLHRGICPYLNTRQQHLGVYTLTIYTLDPTKSGWADYASVQA